MLVCKKIITNEFKTSNRYFNIRLVGEIIGFNTGKCLFLYFYDQKISPCDVYIFNYLNTILILTFIL